MLAVHHAPTQTAAAPATEIGNCYLILSFACAEAAAEALAGINARGGAGAASAGVGSWHTAP
jgi:hypothetical protein